MEEQSGQSLSYQQEDQEEVKLQQEEEVEDDQDYDSETESYDKADGDNQEEWQSAIRNAEQQYIDNAKEYLEWAKAQKKVKVMEEQMPWDTKVQINDISLHRGGPLEDKKYAYFPKYRINIKRGNSVCVVHSEESEEKIEPFFCRRGMRKFYDLIPEYLNEGKKLSGYHQKVKFLTLNEAKEKLDSGQFQVHLYNLFKENGEHCQISYLQMFDMWLIASKNVTILVKQREDAEKYYHKLRYYWAKLISDEWFNILDRMDLQQIQQLKEQMQNFTFIGEHCGNQKHQHIFKYDKVQIIFYSIVQNNSPNVCLPVDQAFEIFKQYNLNMVRIREVKGILSYEELKIKLQKEFDQVASGKIEDEGEGGVVYIVSENLKTQEQKTISCCKLKTTEYNIYRKLREMLKLSLQKKTESGRKNERFKQEVEKMSEHHLPPKPLDYYLALAKHSFAYIDKNFNTLSPDVLRYEFISFIEDIYRKAEANLNQLSSKNKTQIKPTRIILITPPGLLKDETVNKIAKTIQAEQIETAWREDQEITTSHFNFLHMVPRISEKSQQQNIFFTLIGFDENGLQQCVKNLENEVETLRKSKFCSNMFQYINSKNKQQMVELLFSKIQIFITLLKNDYSNQFRLIDSKSSPEEICQIIENDFKQISSVEQNENSKKSGEEITEGKTEKLLNKVNLMVIMPIAPPGSGKTFFCKLLKQTVEEQYPDCSFFSISSDEIRLGLMEQYKKTRSEREYTVDQLFEATAKQAKVKYFSVLKDLLVNISSESKEKAILYLDRMHPPQILEETFSFLKENSLSNINLKISTFLVTRQQGFNYKKYNYYFSEQIFLNCLHRTLNRDNHETLQGDAVLILKIAFKFFQMFRDFKIQSLQNYKQIDLVIQIPLVDETSTINQTLIKKMEKCLDLIPPNGQPPDSPIYMDFIQSFYAANIQFQYPEIERLKKIASNYVKVCLNAFQ
ncbi:RNA ligase (macronuclear) [Tetrahymena thermophila SB210]|uniref:RNA ligase n=1 Tax=Tetrahymena thermophila (strain SB210) TaxID=312017 RepID=Q24HZ4_TETTS|nr:RNA ligase [Tetrahymena thermophila SB210]EAS07444.2 RNA ligase [Tetrahymena thermophila SB210]|eukprot:XP_001027686.2 RNA ligase [Tetrahymena thermophila SB210]